MSAGFYEVLSGHYDELFPLDADTVTLVKDSIGAGAGTARVLDVGSATGSLAVALGLFGIRVTGLELDATMVQAARQKVRNPGLTEFLVGDMRNLGVVLADRDFDVLSCFGNTLVHLPDEQTIESFLRQAFLLLKPGARMFLQILNYDRILINRAFTLPVLETKKFIFHRSYSLRSDGSLDFQTELVDKTDGTTVTDTIPLLPLRKNKLEALLGSVGFGEINFYRDFRKNPLSETAFMLVVEAVKGRL